MQRMKKEGSAVWPRHEVLMRKFSYFNVRDLIKSKCAQDPSCKSSHAMGLMQPMEPSQHGRSGCACCKVLQNHVYLYSSTYRTAAATKSPRTRTCSPSQGPKEPLPACQSLPHTPPCPFLGGSFLSTYTLCHVCPPPLQTSPPSLPPQTPPLSPHL